MSGRMQIADVRLQIYWRSMIGAIAVLLLTTITTANSSVADAARAGDLNAVKTMLKGGGDVNAAH
ncbi:MAG TPA: hypothetical protein VFV51_06220, partial [Vicinamibacterales bacterium]|nr:hypothetical protein [Vicinamibacterales bacterium]